MLTNVLDTIGAHTQRYGDRLLIVGQVRLICRRNARETHENSRNSRRSGGYPTIRSGGAGQLRDGPAVLPSCERFAIPPHCDVNLSQVGSNNPGSRTG
jgi:hypothetical protein